MFVVKNYKKNVLWKLCMCTSPVWMSQNDLPHSLKDGYWHRSTWFGPYFKIIKAHDHLQAQMCFEINWLYLWLEFCQFLLTLKILVTSSIGCSYDLIIKANFFPQVLTWNTHVFNIEVEVCDDFLNFPNSANMLREYQFCVIMLNKKNF